MDLNVLVGRNVRERRLAAGLTQEDLAHRSGMSVVYISQIENGHRNPTVSILARLAEAVGATTAELLLTTQTGSR